MQSVERHREWLAENKSRLIECKKQYYLKNKQRLKEKAKKYRLAKIEYYRSQKRQYREKNKDKENERTNVWRKSHKLHIQAYKRKWAIQNQEKIRNRGIRDIENCSISYIKSLLIIGTSLRHRDIPRDLVELKQLQLKLTRLIKERQND